MQYFKEMILICDDGGNGFRGDYLWVASPLKWSWVEVPTDIDPPLPPHFTVDHYNAQNKGREELVRPFPSSAYEFSVTFPTSGGTYLLYPVASCGLSEGHHQELRIPLPPDADLVVHIGDIPWLLYIPLLHFNIPKGANGAGDRRNTNKEGVTVQAILYVVGESEHPYLVSAKWAPPSFLFSMPNQRNLRQNIFLVITDVDLVVLVEVLGLSGRLSKEVISTPCITPRPTMSQKKYG